MSCQIRFIISLNHPCLKVYSKRVNRDIWFKVLIEKVRGEGFEQIIRKVHSNKNKKIVSKFACLRTKERIQYG